MKSIVAAVFVLGALCATISAQKSTLSDEKKISAVLQNDRVLSNYIKCLLETGQCTRDGRELKKLLPNAIQTGCANCTPQQKKNSRNIINYLRTNRLRDWRALTAKYDPEGHFEKHFKNGFQ